MKIYSHQDYPQMSPEWWALRCGIPTSSEAKKIITAKDARPSASQLKYAEELVTDLINHNPKYFTAKGRPLNKHTEYGRDMEEEARKWFAQSEYCQGMEVEQVGFVTTDDGRFGASPDLLLKKDGQYVGGGEIKNYGILKHGKYRFKKTLALEVKAQIHHCLAVTSLPFWYWVSYNPDLDPLVVKVYPDEFTEALKVQLEAFDQLLAEVKRKAGIGVKEPEVTDTQIVQAWQEKLATRPDRDTLNTWLPEMGEIKDMGTKRQVWNAIKAAAALEHWVFNAEAKAFVEEEASVAF